MRQASERANEPRREATSSFNRMFLTHVHAHFYSLGSGSVVDAAFGKGLFTSLPIFCFAFNCQVQFLPLVAELKGGREEGGETKVRPRQRTV